jgi:hypothetical protein
MEGSPEDGKSNPYSSSACPLVPALPWFVVEEFESVGDISEKEGPAVAKRSDRLGQNRLRANKYIIAKEHPAIFPRKSHAGIMLSKHQ